MKCARGVYKAGSCKSKYGASGKASFFEKPRFTKDVNEVLIKNLTPPGVL